MHANGVYLLKAMRCGYCRSGKHYWLNAADRERCCNPEYQRVQSLSRDDLEADGAERIVGRQIWRGWKRIS